MNYRKKITTMLFLFLGITLLTLLYIFINDGMKCNIYSCFDFLYDERYVFYIFTPSFISVSLLLVLFFAERVYDIWKKFAFIAIPVMIIWIFLTKIDPIACGYLMCTDRTFVIFFSGAIYLVITIIICLVVSLQSTSNKNL